MGPRHLLALCVAGVFVLAGAVLVALARDERRESAPASGFEGAKIPPGLRAPGFSLRNQDGELVRMRELRGRPVVVTFLYAECDETCGPQAQQIKGALNELGHDVPAIAISVDPESDTPARAKRFLAEARMTGRMDFLLGSRRELAPLWGRRGYAIQPQLPGAEHQARIELIDRRGFRRVGFPAGETTPERLAHDLRRLEAE